MKRPNGFANTMPSEFLSQLRFTRYSDTSFVVVLDVRRRGSTLNVEHSVVSVAVWNDVTDVPTAAMIVAVGWKLIVAVSACTGARKKSYWSDRLAQYGRSSPALWRSLSTVLGRRRDVTAATHHTAQGFADFFNNKIYDIRAATSGMSPPPVYNLASSSLSSFQPFTVKEVRRIIMASPTKSLSPVNSTRCRRSCYASLSTFYYCT